MPRKKKSPSATPASPIDPRAIDDSETTRNLLSLIDETRRAEIENEEKRREMATQIAKFRYMVATTVHRLGDGRSQLNMNSHPFQVDILKDDSPDIVVYGSAQWGKSELSICHAVTCAGVCGLKLIWVISKKDKRDKFVHARLDPCLQSVQAYRMMLNEAKDRGADTDSAGLKHFGKGLMNIVFATANREFTSYDGDCTIEDEHQECDQANLKMLDDRMSGSAYGLRMRLGHPTTDGTDENQNLDWLYQNSDRRIWVVPCPTCGYEAELDWEGHVVHVSRNKAGGIIGVKPRDEEFSPSKGLDMRPVCTECHRPMNRLSKKGNWKIRTPGMVRHGYNLSNLYNPSPTCRLDRLYERYLSAKHSPTQMQEFYNKVLGKPLTSNAEKITEAMLSQCASGETGVPVYRFVPIGALKWDKIMSETM